jgi:hypothetical protein
MSGENCREQGSTFGKWQMFISVAVGLRKIDLAKGLSHVAATIGQSYKRRVSPGGDAMPSAGERLIAGRNATCFLSRTDAAQRLVSRHIA